jgi:ATP-dependent Clp protease, protease subunit
MKKPNLLSLLGGDNSIDTKPLGLLHTIYLSGAIEDSKEYVEWFDTIRNAGENDVVKIHINSPGGDLFTAIQFMRVMAESNASIVVSVEGACMSAATMIFLAAEQFEVSEHSMFMFHNYSGMAIGKGGEMYDNIVHERKWSENIMRSVYEDFLTEDEIKSILDNKDIWMDGHEVIKRIKLKSEKLLQKVTKQNEPKPKRARRPATKQPAKSTKSTKPATKSAK